MWHIQLQGYRLETGTAAELRQALTITLTLTDTGFTVLTLSLLGYTRRSPDPRTQAVTGGAVLTLLLGYRRR